VTPAQLEYATGTISPQRVSKKSAVSFEVGVRNLGGASVECDEDSTWISFENGQLKYLAMLDAARGSTILPGDNTLYFRSEFVSEDFPTGQYALEVRVKGFENGLPFERVIEVTDSVFVQEPSQLAINSITVLPRTTVTMDQQNPWIGRIDFENNGEATVMLDSVVVRLFAGPVEVTDEYSISLLGFNPGLDSLTGNSSDSLIILFADNPSPDNHMTTGTIIIEAAIYGTDMNSGEHPVATTELGGKGSFVVQTPADLVIWSIIPSVQRATVLQEKDWFLDVVVENGGESDLEIDFDSLATDLHFSTSNDFVLVRPTELTGGGKILQGNSTDTLRFVVTGTGSAAGVCTITSTVSGVEINSNRSLVTESQNLGVYAQVLIEEEAVLVVDSIVPLQDPVTIGQPNEWAMEMHVRNAGESSLRLAVDSSSTWIDIPDGSGFVFDKPSELEGGGLELGGGQTGILRFTVSTTGSVSPGKHVITGSVLGQELNSDRWLVTELTSQESTDSVMFNLPPIISYVPGSLEPVVLSSGASFSLECNILNNDSLSSTLVLDRSSTYIYFADSDGDIFKAYLSHLSDTVAAGSSVATLRFEPTTVDTSIDRGKYYPTLYLNGTENGNVYSNTFNTAPDSIVVEEASQLSINEIIVPQSVTASQSREWFIKVVVQNNGEASVKVDLDSANTFVSIYIVGAGDRTNEYTIDYPSSLAVSGSDTLVGGRVDTLVYRVTSTGFTTGTALVHARVSARDVNSGENVFDDTFNGGWSNLAVQSPAVPVVKAQGSLQDKRLRGRSWLKYAMRGKRP